MKVILALLSALLFIQAGASPNFSFYVLSSQWAGSVCQQKSCPKAISAGASNTFWNLHGLWPSDGHMGLNFCSKQKFNPATNAGLKSELTKYWNGLFSNANSFHAHEWEKHGTCSGLSQYDYFAKSIQSAKRVDIYGALQRSGIVPGRSYNCRQISDALKRAYGVTNFTVRAIKGQLTAVNLCLTKGFAVQNCPSANVCSGSVNYPVFN